MVQYIDKAAVVAEIERRKKELIESCNDFFNQWACGSLDNILRFLDKCEVKVVDLENEVRKYMEIHHLHIKDGGRIVFQNDDTPNLQCDIKSFAKYFFELGLRCKSHVNIS